MTIKATATLAIIIRTRLDMVASYFENSRLTSRQGQVAVEYVLLLIVGVAIASLIVSLVVSRNEDSPGFLIIKWAQLISLIAGDIIDP